MNVRQIIISAIAGLAFTGPVAAQTTLQIGSPLNTGSFAETYLLEFQDRVAQEIGDEIEIQIFMSNTLGSELDVYEGMQMGTHAAQLTATPLAGINPRVAIWELPFLFADRNDVASFVNGEPGEMLRAGMEGTGMQIVAIWDGGFRVITNNVRPIITPDDMRGVRVRVPNSSFRMAVFQAMGANPTPLAFSELYTALDQGVVDGQENPAQIVLSARFTEVQDYVAMSNHVYVPTHLVIADWFLDSLDVETRETLIAIALDMEEWTRDQGAATDANMRSELEAVSEVSDIDLEAFQSVVAQLYENPTFIDAIGEEMLAVTRETLGQ